MITEGRWQRRRILVWGKTRPELSKSYREIVCTGGVFADTRKLVRVYPIPLRYLDDEQVFRKYQWIEAFVQPAPGDPRPESYRIRADGIETFDRIPTRRGSWDERAEWILADGNVFRSVEAIQEQQAQDHTSLGLVAPSAVKRISYNRFPQKEKEAFKEKYDGVLAQQDLPLDEVTGRAIKPLRPPDYEFKVRFECDDSRCTGHEFKILDWEVDALYFRLRSQGKPPDRAARMVVEKLEQNCAGDKDLHFFLGNISTHLHVFTIVGLWYPRRKPSAHVEQPTLFS